MRRSEYLGLRQDQQSVSAGVQSWDTLPVEELNVLEGFLTAQLSHDQARLEAVRAGQTRGEAEVETFVRNGASLLAYLRALRYLREHGISPGWPRGSITMVPIVPAGV